ncbi:MAG: type IV secretion system DNA-binding domain-containing protein [Patescibacteria group bacterium]
MLTQQDITIIGETNFRNQKVKFGIKQDDRRRHMYVVGKTGMGKTELLKNMAISDILADKGVAIIDPHGDFADHVLNFVPSHRVNDVIYFNPSDMDFPIAFNVMEHVESRFRPLVASGLIGVFKKIWADSWGPRLEYVLRNTILALLEYPGSTLLGIMKMLVDKVFRAKVISKVTDPVVRSFWIDEFSKYPDKFATEAVAPIQNKVGQFLSNSVVRNIVGQTKSKIDLREIMDNKKILIMNLSKGAIGEDVSELLGAMMITKIQLAAMSRVDTPEEERQDFHLYVDEFQNFATESFATILSEARKYHLNLIMGHQYITQMDEMVRDAVFGNVGTMVVFRVGAADAEYLAKEFEPIFTETDIVNLPKWKIYLKLMIDGVARNPFSANTLPPYPMPEKSYKDKILMVSREHYAVRREIIEEKITRWVTSNEDDAKAVELAVSRGEMKYSDIGTKKVTLSDEDREKIKAKSLPKPPAVYKAESNCWSCGVPVKLTFEPDGVRPVYCADCLKKVRAGLISEDNVVQKHLQDSGKLAAEGAISLQDIVKKDPTSFNVTKEVS